MRIGISARCWCTPRACSEMERKKPLRADPEKTRAFQQRAQDKARKKIFDPVENAKTLKENAHKPRSTLKPKGKGGVNPPRPVEKVELPPTVFEYADEWRDRVWALDRGRCVHCQKRVARDADLWVWQSHHPLPKRDLKKERWGHLVLDERFGVVLCAACHQAHEFAPNFYVPFDRLPERVVVAVSELGPRAEALLDRAHPGRPLAVDNDGGHS